MILIKAQRQALLRPLQMVSGIVERRHTLPILSNVLIRKHGPSVSLISTDIEMQITSTVEMGSGPEEQATTVSARKFLDILRALPTDDEVVVSLAGRKMSIAQGKSRFQLQTLAAEEFPTVTPAQAYPACVSLSQKDLKQLLHLVHFSMAQQDIRYYLNGLLLVIEGGQLRAVATDGHRLAYAALTASEAITIQTESDKLEVIVPRKAIMELQKLLSDDDQKIQIELAGNQVKFQLASIELISKLIEGKFPDYQRVIPKGHTKHVPMSREALLGSLTRAAILTTDKFKGVRLSLASGLLKISATNAEQEEALEEIEVDYIGESIDIGFNVQYLMDVLANLRTDQIQLSLQDPNASALITTPNDPEFRYVVMPMRI